MADSNTSLTVWHVGRCGEVAGGMTQVINAYLNWQFDQVQVRVIQSRDGSTGLPALWLFFKALLKTLALPFRSRSGVVVVHLSQGGSFYREGGLLILAKWFGYGTVAQLHGSRFAEFSRRKPRLVKTVLGAANRVHVLSEETGNIVSSMMPANRVVYIPNAVPSGKQVAKEKLVVFGGSVCHRKGVDVLLDAWRQLDSSGWRLVVAGPIADINVPNDLDNVEFPGAVPHQSLMNYLDRAEIAVLPSRDEAMPMFILEALARRCCVISTTVGGIAKVLGEGRGLLASPGDVDTLKACFEQAFEGSQREEIAEKGHCSFQREFSSEAVYPNLEALWYSVAN